MATPASEVISGGHTASFEQAYKSVQRWLAEGATVDEILRRLGEDLASGRLEHGELRPSNTVVYEIKEGKLYSASFDCFIEDLFNPDPNNTTPGYPEMLERNKENIRKAQESLVNGAKEAWVASDAADYKSNHGVIYKYREVDGKILMDSIDGPKETKDLMDFMGRLSGVMPEPIYGSNGELIGMHTVSKNTVTNLTKNQIIELLSTYGDREQSLIARYQNMPHEISESLAYFEKKVQEAVNELRGKVDFDAVRQGDYDSLAKVVESITTELKGYEARNAWSYSDTDNYNLSSSEALRRERGHNAYHVSIQDIERFYSQEILAAHRDEGIKWTQAITKEQSSLPLIEQAVDRGEKPQGISLHNLDRREGLIQHSSIKSRNSVLAQLVEKEVLTMALQAQRMSRIEINRLKDPLYRIAHSIEKPKVILNKARSEGWQSWLAMPAAERMQINNEKQQKPLVITPLQKREETVRLDTVKSQESLAVRRPVRTLVQTVEKLEQLLNKHKTNTLKPESAFVERRQLEIQKSLQLNVRLKQLPVVTKEMLSELQRRVVISIQKNIPQQMVVQSVAKIAKVITANPVILKTILTINPHQLTRLLQLSRGMIQTLLLTRPDQPVRVPLQALKMIAHILSVKAQLLTKTLLEQKMRLGLKEDGKQIDPKLVELRKITIEALKLIRKLSLEQRENKLKGQSRLPSVAKKELLLLIDPKLRALLMQLLKEGVLDELLASEDDWLLSLMEVRRQRTKREMRFNTENVREKIRMLSGFAKNKDRKQRIIELRTKRRQKHLRQKVQQVQKSASVVPTYDLLPSTSMSTGSKPSTKGRGRR